MKKFRTAAQEAADAKANLHQPHYEAQAWRNAELGPNGEVARGELAAKFEYYPATGTFYLTKQGRHEEVAYDDRFEVPLEYYLRQLANYVNRPGFHVVARMHYPWEAK